MQRCLALKASAGSGKTFALTVRYISLLLLDAKPKEILALTFTNKAAAQMTQRIYDTLVALGEDPLILDEVSKQTSLSKQKILDKKSIILQRYNSDELAIYTIDKFVNKILREFCGFIDLSDDFNISFDDEELLVYKFLSDLDESTFENLISFVHSENKRLSSIVELFKILIDKNDTVDIQKYPKESFYAVQKVIMDDAKKIQEFVRQSDLSKSAMNAVGFDDIDSLLDKGKSWLAKETLGEFHYFKKSKTIDSLDSEFKSLKKNIQLYFHIKESYTLQKLFGLFQRFKEFRDNYNKKRNSLEFSDVTNIVYKLLQNKIKKEFLYFRLDSQYHHILIDEFQDTSTLQFKILKYLIEEIISGDPEVLKTFFYVGDVKQSIYRFRGGQKELFDYVAKIFSYELKVEPLNTNYRSGQSVVEFVNNIFLQVPNYPYERQYVKSDIKGYVEVFETIDEADSIYETVKLKVQELLDAGVDFHNIAILTYTNKDVLNIFEYLKKEFPNIKIATEMTSKLVNQSSVKALINGMRYLYFKEKIYLYNFNALTQKEYDEPFSFQSDLYKKPYKILKQMAFFYNILDEDVIKFIQSSYVYENMVDFVYEIDKSDATVTTSQKRGLQILTIFKSKGLEFDTVIVCDRISKKSYDKTSLLFEYEDIELKNIFYKKSGRENLDSYYGQALNKEKKLIVDDELNILYVALTRAQYNMVVIKKEKNSVFKYLGELLVQKNGSLFIKKEKQKKKNIQKILDYFPLNLGSQEKQIKSDKKEYSQKSIQFGNATHYCLENLSEFTQHSLDESFIYVQNKFSALLDNQQLDDLYNRVQMLLNNQEFISLTNGAVFLKEQALVYKQEHKIIDLLLFKENKNIIVDYKTSQEKSLEHIDQVEFYKQAVQNITQKESLGYLIYLYKDSVEILKV